jgi:hypothetical protein
MGSRVCCAMFAAEFCNVQVLMRALCRFHRATSSDTWTGECVSCVMCLACCHRHHFSHSSHSINASDPAPHQNERKREHCSILFATTKHIPCLHIIDTTTSGVPRCVFCMLMCV